MSAKSKKTKFEFKGGIPVVLYVLVLGLIVRLIAIDQSFWLDEATSGLVVRNYNFSEILTVFSRGDFHPPLYYLVLKAWAIVGGTGEVWLRTLSLVFGLVTIYAVYLIGREVKDRSVGNLAALLMALAPLHVYYSQEARMYSMGAALVSVEVYFFLKVIGKKAKNWEWIGFASILLLSFLTDYLLVLLLPVFWLMALVLGKKKQWWVKFGLGHLPLLAGGALWWPVLREQLVGGMGVEGSVWWKVLGVLSMKNVALIPVKFMIGRIGFGNVYLYGLVVVLAMGITGYTLMMATKKIGKLMVVWAWLLLPLAMGVAISLFVPVLTYFRFLFVLPAMYILAAAGLLQVKEKYFFPLVLMFLVGEALCLGIYFQNDKFHREDWRGLTEYVSQNAGENSRVVFVVNSQMEGYRYYDSQRELYFGTEGVTGEAGEIWLMRYVWDVFDPQDRVRQEVETKGYTKESEFDFNGVVVWRYQNNENRD